ncbi:hypothetical protein L596_029441 [Steinernema carpocapsae]|uniref:Uncharacterized protein n=1 Tax=Steinernema carpocapsae TaxID=34508 RepID=A0A4V5ZXH1_STECR|nr:hypothetical protein L596_029441 [Steinernema carpocapsae]
MNATFKKWAYLKPSKALPMLKYDINVFSAHYEEIHVVEFNRWLGSNLKALWTQYEKQRLLEVHAFANGNVDLRISRRFVVSR